MHASLVRKPGLGSAELSKHARSWTTAPLAKVRQTFALTGLPPPECSRMKVCVSASATATAPVKGGDLAQVEDAEGLHQFRNAVWVADLLPPHLVSTHDEEDETGSASAASVDDDEEPIALEDLPQGYRTADRIALYNVPVHSNDGALMMQAAGLDADGQLVVCKVSQYRDNEGQVDWFKFAATLNEWTCFNRHADNLQSRHLVQLLGYYKSADSISIVSEFCAGGDLQRWMDRHGTASSSNSSSAYTSNSRISNSNPSTAQPPALVDRNFHSSQPFSITPEITVPVNQRMANEPHIATSISSSCNGHEADATIHAHQHLQPMPSTHGNSSTTSGGAVGAWFRSAASLLSRALTHNIGLQSLVAHSPIVQPQTPTRRIGAKACACRECGAKYCSASAHAEQQVALNPELSCVWPREIAPPPPPTALALEGQSTAARMSEAQVAHVALHVVKGLVTLHKAGLTHGDIKPANVFISPVQAATAGPGGGHHMLDTDVFKLGDFGTLREKGRQHLHYFVSGFGYTPEYASPEALRHGTAHASCSSDLWSLGIMMQQLLLGRLPNTAVAMARLHEAGTAHECESYLRTHPPACAALRELADDGVFVSPFLEQVIRSCLQVSPKDRSSDAMCLMKMDWFTKGTCHLVEQVLKKQQAMVQVVPLVPA